MPIVSKTPLWNQRVGQFAQAYAANRPLVQRGLRVGFILYVLTAAYRALFARPIPRKREGKDAARKEGKSDRVTVRFPYIFPDKWLTMYKVDAVFYQRLGIILRIVIPGIRSKEALLLFMHSSLLVFRTAISLYVAALDGKCV